MGAKSILKELLWFLKGQTDSKLLEAQGVNIWKGNSTRDFLDQRGLTHYREGDIGPMYFFNVYHHGAEYKGCDADYSGQGFNQMSKLIDGLKKDPFSRRHMLTTYNPAVVDQGVLAPCHGIVIQFYVSTDMLLDCHVYIRSWDLGLGAPYNIASYAILANIIAAKVGMQARELIISTGDTHVYKTHVQALSAQLERTPYPFPKLSMSPTIGEKEFTELTLDDFQITGYFHHPTIKMEMAV